MIRFLLGLCSLIFSTYPMDTINKLLSITNIEKNNTHFEEAAVKVDFDSLSTKVVAALVLKSPELLACDDIRTKLLESENHYFIKAALVDITDDILSKILINNPHLLNINEIKEKCLSENFEKSLHLFVTSQLEKNGTKIDNSLEDIFVELASGVIDGEHYQTFYYLPKQHIGYATADAKSDIIPFRFVGSNNPIETGIKIGKPRIALSNDGIYSDYSIKSVWYRDNEYHLSEFVPTRDKDGVTVFKNIKVKEDKEELEQIISNHTFTELVEYASSYPAIKELDSFKSKRIQSLDHDSFIDCYQQSKEFQSHPEVATRLPEIIEQSNVSQMHLLSQTLNNNHFLSSYDQLDGRLKNKYQTFSESLEQRLDRLSSNKKLIESLPSTELVKIQHHIEQVKSNKEQIKEYLRPIKSCLKGADLIQADQDALVRLAIRASKDNIFLQRLNRAVSGFNYQAILKAANQGLDKYYRQQAETISGLSESNKDDLITQLYDQIEHTARHSTNFSELINRDQFYIDLKKRADDIKINTMVLAKHLAKHLVDQFIATPLRATEQVATLFKSLNIVLPEIPGGFATQVQQENQNSINDYIYQTAQVWQEYEHQSNLDVDEIAAVKETLQTTLPLVINLNNANFTQEAREIITGLETLSQCLKGVKAELVDQGVHKAHSLAIGAGLTTAQVAFTYAFPQVSVPYHVGRALFKIYKTYGICSSSKQIINEIQEFYTAIKDGKPYDAGKYGTKIASDALSFFVPFYKKNKLASTPQFANALKQGAIDAEIIDKNCKNAQELYALVIKSPKFENYAKGAFETGISQQAWDKRVRELCLILSDPKDVCAKLSEINKASKIKPSFIPIGLNSPLKIKHDHKHRLEFLKNGRIQALHFDSNNKILKAGKVSFIHVEKESNGMYRAIISINGQIKESSFFCNKINNHMTLTQRIYEALSVIDYTQKEVRTDGKIYLKIPFQGGYLEAVINKSNSIIETCYSWHPNWTQTLWEKYFKKKNS